MFSSDHDTTTSALEFSEADFAPGRLWVVTTSSGVIFSTRAAKRCFSSAVSPGTSTNVPDDCSPARMAAAFSTASGVSMK